MIRTMLQPRTLRWGHPLVEVDGWEAWREAARRLLLEQVAPDDIEWVEPSQRQLLLGTRQTAQHLTQPHLETDRSNLARRRGSDGANPPAVDPSPSIRVPKRFTELARTVSCHRGPQRWNVLYRAVWRMAFGEPELLIVTADPDVRVLLQWEREVRSDVEAMKAGMRFRRIGTGAAAHYVAWYSPTHHVLDLVVPFLRRRFGIMQWSVFTPAASVYWDGERLQWGAGDPEPPAVSSPNERIEQWWLETGLNLVSGHAHQAKSRRSGFARAIKQSPVALASAESRSDRQPPSSLADSFRLSAGTRTSRSGSLKSAEEYLPEDLTDLESLRVAASECRGCDLHCHATQTVFGSGVPHAKLVLVGEQPGDVEDRRGVPFVGPAGLLLEEVLEEVGIDRQKVYVTNVVKHFKWVPRGKRRSHAKPSAREVTACRPWIEAELSAIRPQILVCLGATAIGSLLGTGHRLTKEHGRIFASQWAPKTMITWHPSAILRAMSTDEGGAALRASFTADLKKVAQLLRPRRSK